VRGVKNMFGILKNGILIHAPNVINAEIEIDGVKRMSRVYNPNPEHYKSAGYMEIIELPYLEVTEDEVKYFEKVYTERDGVIYGEWVETDPPKEEAPTPTLDERVTDCENALVELAELITEGE
jgi:hypothetical protein